MCGIIGVVGGGPAEKAAMREHVLGWRHRGRDAQRVKAAPGFTFRLTLLSAIGSSPIRQPIASKVGSAVVTRNARSITTSNSWPQTRHCAAVALGEARRAFPYLYDRFGDTGHCDRVVEGTRAALASRATALRGREPAATAR